MEGKDFLILFLNEKVLYFYPCVKASVTLKLRGYQFKTKSFLPMQRWMLQYLCVW